MMSKKKSCMRVIVFVYIIFNLYKQQFYTLCLNLVYKNINKKFLELRLKFCCL